MIVVAGTSIVFASFGVNAVAAIVLSAFVISALIAKPASTQDWIILLIAGFAAFPYMGIAYDYSFNFPRAQFLRILAPTIVAILLTWVVYSWTRKLGPSSPAFFRAFVMLLAALWWLLPIFFLLSRLDV